MNDPVLQIYSEQSFATSGLQNVKYSFTFCHGYWLIQGCELSKFVFLYMLLCKTSNAVFYVYKRFITS